MIQSSTYVAWFRLTLLVPLAGCSFPPPQNSADRLTLASCRSDANRIYNVQNRAQLSERSSVDTPFSGAAQPGLPSDGLADRYSQERMVDACIQREAGAEPTTGGAN